jgi:hypothetical protein
VFFSRLLSHRFIHRNIVKVSNLPYSLIHLLHHSVRFQDNIVKRKLSTGIKLQRGPSQAPPQPAQPTSSPTQALPPQPILEIQEMNIANDIVLII